MPFKLGAAPIRRTIKYLESGPLVFRDKVKCVMVNYNVDEEVLYVKERPTLHPLRRAAMEKKPWWIKAGPEHRGAQDFAFWNLPQVQYKNPNVQIVVQRNMTPTPFITCFLDDGEIMKLFHRQIVPFVFYLGKQGLQCIYSKFLNPTITEKRFYK